MELINNIAKAHEYPYLAEWVKRTWEGNDLYMEMKECERYFYLLTISSILSKRDPKYRPYWVECLHLSVIKPTLIRNGFFTRKNYFTKGGSITSIQAVYVPRRFDRPRSPSTFAHLDATTVLSRGLVRQRYLSGRSFRFNVNHASTSDPILGLGELSEEDRLLPRKIERFLSQPFFVAEVFTGSPGKCVGLEETIRGFQLILFGELDGLPEQAFYLVEMTLNLSVLTPNRIVWDSEVEEIVLSTNSDIRILRILLNDQWLTMVLMGGFARIGNNEITLLVNDAEKGSDINPQEAQQTLEIAEANVKKAEGRRQKIEANLALR
ncbi:hypothetical protein H5410_056291 [Solanum commersonii]|uniref:H(+)-transporting two-sector ATPase n=1 Tax=Solanum commersonii TaxID=4109 RepID=A0A9J5WLA6_SOLCO|nr:hypothetical protein H5410_056291 [Solanum commersonii]